MDTISVTQLCEWTRLRYARSNFSWLSPSDLAALTPPPALIDGILPTDSLVLLSGIPGSYKSFLALDMAMCIATGTSWAQRPTAPGLAYYVAAEGRWGLRKRQHAWAQDRMTDVGDVALLTLPHAIDLTSPDTALALLESFDAPPALLVIDTLSRCFGGGDENSPFDMGNYVMTLDILREKTGACILTLHHSTKRDPLSSRGHSILSGAVDTHMALSIDEKSPEPLITLSCIKQKDDDPFTPLYFVPRIVPWQEQGKPLSSLVLDLKDSTNGCP